MICNFFKKLKKEEDGTAAIEFALIAIPFLMLLVGIMEAGRVVWMVNSVQYTIEETNRYAAVHPDLSDQEFEDYALTKLAQMRVPTTSFSVITTTFTVDGIDFVETEGAYEISTMLSFIPGDFGNFNFEANAKKVIAS